MIKEEHYKKTKEFFKSTAIENEGFYDSKKKKDYYIWQKMVRKQVIKVLKPLISGKIRKIADFGCGRGDFISRLAEKYISISFTGTDFSEETLQIARNISKNINNLEFKEANLLSLNFKDKSFDISMCINVLLHIHENDLDKALSELARVTGKYLILEIKNKNDLYNSTIRGKQEFPYSLTTKEFVSENLEKNGFKLKGIKPLFLFEPISPIIILLFKRVK